MLKLQCLWALSWHLLSSMGSVHHGWTPLAKMLYVWPEGLEWFNWPQIHLPHRVCISRVWGEEATLLLTSWRCSLPWVLLVGCGHTVALWCRYFKMLSRFGRECLSHFHSSCFSPLGCNSAVVEVICYFCCWGRGVMYHTPKLRNLEEN